ncbi:hypothetical protein LY76DRAFT_650678 [Colletotrichum caudatum]|nr:hypothetical protein LY76DRAFT_650678 [Colletotrichum caudatum]
MLRGDESYGRNSGYYCLLEAFRDVFERGEDHKAIDAAANRPLQDGGGVHAWVGLKMTRSRGSVMTFYLPSEILAHCL